MHGRRAWHLAFVTWLNALLLLLPHSSIATEISDKLSLRGFYTLGVTYSDADGASIPTLDSPITLDRGETTTDESLLGLQADYAITDVLDFTLQLVSTRQTEDAYDPSVEWAYLNYDFGNDLHLRGGKMKLSMLQGVELRYVGFSRLWVRPLVPTSGAGGFDDYNGVEFIKGVNVGSYNLQFQGGYGKADHYFDFIDNRDVKFLNAKIEKNGSWVSLALLHSRYDVDTQTGIDLKDNARLLMGSIESELHLGNAIINAGYAYGDAEINPDEQLAYLSVGYRISNFTPYLLRSQRKMDFDASEYTGSSLPPPGPPPLPMPDGTDSTDTIAVGLRYDLTPTFSIKGQWDHWSQNDDSHPKAGVVKNNGNLFTIVFEGVF